MPNTPTVPVISRVPSHLKINERERYIKTSVKGHISVSGPEYIEHFGRALCHSLASANQSIKPD